MARKKFVKKYGKRNQMNIFDIVTTILIIIGGLNWGLVGLFDFNLVTFLSFGISMLERTVYVLVGASSLYGAIRLLWLWLTK